MSSPYQKYSKADSNAGRSCIQLLTLLLLVAMVHFLAACSGGGAAPTAGNVGSSTGSSTGGSGTGTDSTNLSLSALTFGVNPLSAYGTNSITVNVLNNGVAYQTPTTVTFSSPCATAGKADLSPLVTSVNGVATASYLDKACGGDDLITASIATGASATATLTTIAPVSGYIQFVSASPTTIALKGTGGAGLQETSQVTFKVLDSSGTPIGGKTVNFSLSTAIGGLSLSSTTATSAAGTGLVVTDVRAGTVGTPVRVTATTTGASGTTLSTMSDQLVISTGVPDQDSFSISIGTFNIEGLNYDGVSTSITAHLYDHFNNPVPDGTAVYFTAEGGGISPSCLTLNGTCSVTLISNEPRPADGRVTVLAYAVGEESFTDLDGDGLADFSAVAANNELKDNNGLSTDMPEAWVDWNENNVHDANEPIIDFNSNSVYDAGDSKYNGAFCSETADPNNANRVSNAGSCSSVKTIHVRDDGVVVFSGSWANTIALSTQLLSNCKATDILTLMVTDINGNPMPAGTTVTVSSTGEIVTTGTTSFTVSNTTGTGGGATLFPVQITGGTSPACTSSSSGSLTVSVTTPRGNNTTDVFGISMDPGIITPPPITNLTLSPITLGLNPLAAYGTTSVEVTILENGVPYATPSIVNFSSICASAGKASLTSNVTTINGLATASYLDQACAGTDIITAAISNGQTATTNLVVTPPSSGSIKFVSATPTSIALKGTGGAGRQETSRVIFQVSDIAGNPIGGKTVNFNLNTRIGGLSLVTDSATSDPTTGYVIADVQAGTVGTPVRVTATTTGAGGVILSSQSDLLVIATGLPDQDSISLSANPLNIEGAEWDGIESNLTILLADHFNNPVPDGTVVYFTTESGAISPSCTTTNGACSVTLRSQGLRPADGRVTVLAYAVGEESFTDVDGDGLADLAPAEMLDINGFSTDMPEAWVDWNENSVRNANEPFIDFNSNGLYDSADGQYNGVFCSETADPNNAGRVSSPGTCATQKTIHVMDDIVITFSGSSNATVTLTPTDLGGSCANTTIMMLSVTDFNSNPMPAGTTISISSAGNIITTGTTSFTVKSSNTTGDGATVFSPQITGGTFCVPGSTGTLEITITTPLGVVTKKLFTTSVS